MEGRIVNPSKKYPSQISRKEKMMRKSIATAIAAVGFFSVLAGGAVATAQEIPLSGGTPSVGPEIDSNTPSGVSARAGCELFTWEVGQSGNNLGVRGARQGCSDWGAITVELRKARPFLPDLNLAQASNSGTGYIDAVAYTGCNGRAQYFGKTISGTGTTQEGVRFDRC